MARSGMRRETDDVNGGLHLDPPAKDMKNHPPPAHSSCRMNPRAGAHPVTVEFDFTQPAGTVGCSRDELAEVTVLFTALVLSA